MSVRQGMTESSNAARARDVSLSGMRIHRSAVRARVLIIALALLPAAAAAQSSDAETLRRLKTVDWPRAYQTQDLALLDRILADDFYVVRADGSWSSKRDELEWLRDNRPSYDSLIFNITRLDIYANGTAIVAGTGQVHSRVGARSSITAYESTNVLTRDASGQWRAVASHTSGSRPLAPTRIVDHHVHVLGPDVVRDWKRLGETFSRPDSVYLSPSGLFRGARGDSLAAVVLVPMAHLYGIPDFTVGLVIDAEEAHRRVRRENAYVSSVAARFGDRAVALCSVPALAAWAVDDLRWCRDSLGVAGIKLHLASSQVDLREPAHLARLAEIAAFAERSELPILLHVDPQRRGHTVAHVRALAERMFAPFPNLVVVIAHLGGSGGYGPWTRSVFATLRDWRRDAERDGRRRHLYFELSAVVLEAESEEVPPTTEAELEMLRTDLRAMGLDRVLFGSDYPVFDPLRGQQALLERLRLTSDEVNQIVRGVPGGLFRRKGR